MNRDNQDDFYIGWQAEAPPALGRKIRVVVWSLIAVLLMVGAGLAVCQRTIGVAVFEWGTIKTFHGVLQARPYPQLWVPRPRAGSAEESYSSYSLVAPFKFGLDPGLTEALDQKPVTLMGTLIYRGDKTTIEVQSGTLRPDPSAKARPTPHSVATGRQTLRGEIVDSKCFLGVMNPGRWKPHRACAVRCISGGIPPLLVVRTATNSLQSYLLVASDGRPVNKDVLAFVAEPVEITGDVEQQGDVLILRADPRDYRRL